MADQNIVTNIVANADFSNLISDVNRVTTSLSKLQESIANSNKMLGNQINVMNKAFSDTLKSTGQFSTHFVSLQSDVEKFGKNLDGGKLKLGQYFQTLQTHAKTSGGVIRDLAKQQVALQNAVLQPLGKNAQGLMQFNVHVPRGLDEVKNKTSIARQELQIMNKVIQQGAGQLINWGKNTQWAGRQLSVGLTLPLAAFGKASADAFKKADQELVRLTKVYGDIAGVSAQELQKVRSEVSKTANEISKAYGVSFADTIALAADIAATGKQGNELLQSVKETTRLSVLGEVDRQEAMKATLAIQTAFKQNTEELTQSINFLNAVENQTSTTLNDLVEAIPKAGPIVKGLGGDVKDLALYLTAMREGGINATEGANALKSGLASLINPTKIAKEMFDGFGISLTSIVETNAGNTTGAILELQSALETLNPLQKQQALEQLFGKFQFARMNALFENLGKQGSQTLQVLDLMKASSQDLAEVAGRELSQVTESASGRYKRALEGLKADLAVVGEQFLNINTTLINVVDKILQFVNNLPKPLKQFLSVAGALTAVAGPLIMLTGVLANFFGYILKGVSHMRALFKGGEGWKYLTPEMLAAEKAGSLVEATFYNDAKAAGVLQLALRNLIDEFAVLEAKAKSAAVSVNPGIQTMAGTVVTAGGIGAARQVNPNHPLLSPTDTRSMSHMNPVSGMTEQQKLAQTIFGVVPGAPRVNNKIKDNPQMYMSGDLPKVEGFSSIRGASTGVVAAEAAKWHAMTGALAMQSEAEIALLKTEVAATGNITSSLSDSYSQLLPEMSALTSKAAAASAQIVAELQANKINVDQARAKITALNTEIEIAMGQAAQGVAQATGRNINLTQLPLVNQPVVDAAGKSNMKELLRPGRTRSLLNSIAGRLGVKTFGAPYSTETTMPKRMATGGSVPGTGNTDTVPAMLTPGEFVINKEATAANLPLLQAINGGMGNNSLGRQEGGFMSATMLWQGSGINGLLAHPDQDKRRQTFGLGPGDTIPGNLLADDMVNVSKKGLHPGGLIFDMGSRLGYSREELIPAVRSIDSELRTMLRRSGNLTVPQYNQLSEHVINRHLSRIKRDSLKLGRSVSFYEELKKIGFQRNANNKGMLAGSQQLLGFDGVKIPVPLATTGGGLPASMARAHFSMQSELLSESQRIKTPDFGSGEKTLSRLLRVQRGHTGTSGMYEQNPNISKKFPDTFLTQAHGKTNVGMPLVRRGTGYGRLTDIINKIAANSNKPFLTRGRPASGPLASFTRRNKGGIIGMNSGGMVPGYNDGGMVRGYQEGGEVLPGRFGSQFNAQRDKGFIGKGLVGGPMAGFGVGMGMQMAGGMMGGQTGTMLQMASILPMMAPGMLSGIPKMLGGITGGLKGVGGAAGLAGKAMGIAFRVGPILAITAAISGAAFAYKQFKKEQAQNALEQTNSVAITEKSAKEAGIKFNNLSDSIKAVNDQLDLARAKGKNAYQSLNSAGIQGLTLSIKELKANIKDAKKNQTELVSTFTNIDSGTDLERQRKVMEIATNLKAQFVAAGMSAQDATNKIYSIISASDKADMAFNAISSKGFREILDSTTAAESMITKLVKNMDNLSGDDLGKAFSNVTAALDVNLNKLMKTKDENGKILTEQEAMSKVLDDINKKEGAKTTITQGQINSLKKTQPELAKILNTTDDVAGMYAKWRLLLSGVRTDLSKISSEQAQSMAAFESALGTAITASEQSNVGSGVAYKSQQSIIKLQKQIAAGGDKAAVNAQKTQDQIKEEIKLIDKKIDKINEEADARKRALEANQSKENLALEIQKAQLEYVDKIAAGDMIGAAQAQLNIKQLLGERESQKAIDAIEENRAKREKEQLAIREKLQAQSDKAAKNLTSAQNNASVATERMSKVDQYQNAYQNITKQKSRVDLILKEDPGNKQALKDQQDLVRGPLGDLAKQISADAKGSDKALAAELKSIFGGNLIDANGNSLAGKVVSSTAPKGVPTYREGSADRALAKDSASALSQAEAITGGKTLKDLYNAYLGIGTAGSTTSSSALPISEDSRYGKNTNKGGLSQIAKETIVRENKLKVGQFFEYGGNTYKVKAANYIVNQGPTPVKKSLGGAFSAGQKLIINDRINPLGIQEEGIMIKPTFSGMIYPNASTMPRYNVSNQEKSYGNVGSGSNVYNVNMTFAEAPKNGKQLFNEFKDLLRKETSKTGESIVIGGKY